MIYLFRGVAMALCLLAQALVCRKTPKQDVRRNGIRQTRAAAVNPVEQALDIKGMYGIAYGVIWLIIFVPRYRTYRAKRRIVTVSKR